MMAVIFLSSLEIIACLDVPDSAGRYNDVLAGCYTLFALSVLTLDLLAY